MSTRATYKVTDELSRLEFAFYIHHDGYPEGAAEYFRQFVDYDGSHRGGACSVFLRSIENSELTSSHESHGDTEYRYNIIKNDGLLQLESLKFNYHTENFQKFYNGSIYEFINKYSKSEKFYHIQGQYRKEWRTLGQLEKLATDSESEYLDYKKRSPTSIGNLRSIEAKHLAYKNPSSLPFV